MTKKKAEITKEKILQAATHLFSQKGFYGVSARDLVAAAGTNISVVYYHFGSKEKLYEACIVRFITDIDIARRDALQKIDTTGADDPELTLTAILSAFTAPHYKLLLNSEGFDYVHLIARCFSEPPELSTSILNKYYAETRKLYCQAIADVLDSNQPKDVILRVFSFFVEYMLSAPVEVGVVNHRESTLTIDEVRLIEDLVIRFGVGGFSYALRNET